MTEGAMPPTERLTRWRSGVGGGLLLTMGSLLYSSLMRWCMYTLDMLAYLKVECKMCIIDTEMLNQFAPFLKYITEFHQFHFLMKYFSITEYNFIVHLNCMRCVVYRAQPIKKVCGSIYHYSTDDTVSKEIHNYHYVLYWRVTIISSFSIFYWNFVHAISLL